MDRSSLLYLQIVLLSFGQFLTFIAAGNSNCIVKGLFVFGGAEVDNGNNNDNHCKVRANFLPYGVDFPDGPTGRFSNGKLVSDSIADTLKLPSPPPYIKTKLQSTSIKIDQGVNFGSAGSGILDTTGVLLGITTFRSQIDNFMKILPRLENSTGLQATNFLQDYAFMVGAGEEDFKSYYMFRQDIIWTPQTFADLLIHCYFTEVMRLYEKGARKFVLVSVAPIGFSPFLRKKKKASVEDLNKTIKIFTDLLIAKVKGDWKKKMPDSETYVIDSAEVITEIITNTDKAGFTNVDSACCELSPDGICKASGKSCEDRAKYVYFDGMRPTEIVNNMIASKFGGFSG